MSKWNVYIKNSDFEEITGSIHNVIDNMNSVGIEPSECVWNGGRFELSGEFELSEDCKDMVLEFVYGDRIRHIINRMSHEWRNLLWIEPTKCTYTLRQPIFKDCEHLIYKFEKAYEQSRAFK